ncbi:MAG: hypothetical protein RIK85_17250 [Marinobacter sp.]
MSEPRTAKESNTLSLERSGRKFSVSANRAKANHKVRYVETGGASVDSEECTFCQSVPDVSDDGER